MRILLITPYFYPHKGGSQQYAEELYYHLMQVDPSVKVDVICYNTDGAKEMEQYRGFTVYRVPCIEILPGQFAIPNYFKLWSLLNNLFKKKTYNFINSHTRFFDNSWWTPFVAKYFKTKSMLTDHCADHPTHSSKIVTWITHFVDRVWVPFISRFYDVITVTNGATYKFWESLGFTNQKIIYGGVDTQYFKPAQNKSNLLISFVGRMIPSKGPQILLEIAQELVVVYPEVTFVFAGGGSEFEKLSIYATDRIAFMGTVNKDDVAKLLSETDILVHPSLHHEGFPNVLLEAGAAGCSVVATDMGGTKEIVIHEKTGLLVQPRKEEIKTALIRLIENTDERIQFSTHIRSLMESTFDWRMIAEKFLAFSVPLFRFYDVRNVSKTVITA